MSTETTGRTCAVCSGPMESVMDKMCISCFDKASEHKYSCSCKACRLWWGEMPSEFDESDAEQDTP